MTDKADVVHPKAGILQVKREISRKTRRRQQEHVAEELNIVAMMDMMTIILVFLLKSLSSSPANVPQSDDLRLPHSTVNTSPSQALQVIVSRVSITVNGRFITSLRNGYVDPSQKRGGGTGLMINPLAESMRDQVQVARTIAERAGQPFRGEIAIIADHGIPSRTIFEVLYTCGQSGFAGFQLLVLKARSST
ncbi:MAG: biopolymer transporter ExbD [Deltaproteobacteria bacterium]|nr:biopolymer transporter ExbD [Myxococcales bacterium]MDP3213892.1 biopolymer transporter ExbD [Deltaproteobacteria bacterium]